MASIVLFKYNTFNLEQPRKFKKDKFNSRNWEYIASEDAYICPAGKKVKYLYPRVDVNERGFVSWEKIYQCEDIETCQEFCVSIS